MRIDAGVLQTVLDHARATWPRECCGILLAEGDAPRSVTRALRGENEERGDPRHKFRLGRRAHLHAVELELAGRARIAGYYHSHPHGGVAPSTHDAEMAAKDSRHLIVSASNVAAWRWTGQRFIREPLDVEPAAPGRRDAPNPAAKRL
jgi:proteasome lid subunit RPN8/RPN11